MRVIAGTYRSRILKSLKGLALRPTSDRLRETLFNILGTGVAGARFVDVFAGTGAVGIEALSRGAAEVVFIENHPPASALIRKNLESLGVRSGASVLCTDALRGLGTLAAKKKGAGSTFDFVFLDPPYAAAKEYARVLRVLGSATFLAPGSVVIAEHHKKFDLPVHAGSLTRFRVLKQGDAALSFYRHGPGEAEGKQFPPVTPAGSSKELGLDILEGDPDLRNSFIVVSDGVPGDMAVKLVSKSESRLRAVELEAKDEKDENNGGSHPWSLEGGTESTLLLFNHGKEVNKFTVFIGAGAARWEKDYFLEPMQTEAISIRGLIQNEIKDNDGKTLPRTILSGAVNWTTPNSGVGKGRILQSNRDEAMARNFSCGSFRFVCGVGFSPGIMNFTPGDTVGFGSIQTEFCVGPAPCSPTESDPGVRGFLLVCGQYRSGPDFRFELGSQRQPLWRGGRHVTNNGNCYGWRL